MSDPPAVAITGANGYVGSALCAAFRAAGYRVIALQRSAPRDGTDHIPYTLEDGPAGPLPPEVAAVVHCAYDLKARSRSEIEATNLGGLRTLLAAARGIRVVLISSMSAYPGTGQIYGQTKLAAEAMVTAAAGTSLRLGLVYGGGGGRGDGRDGGGDGGMVGALRSLAGLPVVPVLRPDSYQFTVHVDDMARCVVDAVRQPPPHSVLGVANPRRLAFSAIMRTLRADRTDRAGVTIPVPARLLYRSLSAAERMGLRPPFRADSLLGLMRPAETVPHVEYWAARGCALRDFAGDTAGQAP